MPGPLHGDGRREFGVLHANRSGSRRPSLGHRQVRRGLELYGIGFLLFFSNTGGNGPGSSSDMGF